MKNLFNSIEWPAIREGLAKLFPEALPIVKWEQQAEGVTHLDDGTTLHCDRGSEHGETLGPLKVVGALAIARERARGSSDVTAFSGVQDEWFVDDGVVVCRPELFDGWLQVFDRELERIGASRGRGENAKSTAKLVCAFGTEQAFEGWDTAYVRETCKVLPVNEPTEYLGTVTGGGDGGGAGQEGSKSLQAALRKARAKRGAINTLRCPAAELTLLRRCADVAAVTYWLRCHGDRIRPETLAEHDADIRAAVENTLDGSIPDTAWWQATLGVRHGGLGLRAAEETALPAFIGSRTACRPLVATLLARSEAAGIGHAATLLRAYDTRTEAAWVKLAAKLPQDSVEQGRIVVIDGSAAAERRWKQLLAGDHAGEEGVEGNAMQAQRVRGIGGAGLVLDAGAEDPEHPAGKPAGPAVQRALQALADGCGAEGLRQHFWQAGAYVDAARLRDLCDPETDHAWIWDSGALGAGDTFDREEFVEAVRVRLGAGAPLNLPCVGIVAPRFCTALAHTPQPAALARQRSDTILLGDTSSVRDQRRPRHRA